MSASTSRLSEEFLRLLVRAPEEFEGTWQGVYLLHDDFTGFSGHFPDYPLMPAMMQVFMAAHFISLVDGAWPDISSLPVAKFTEQARPGDSLLVSAKQLPPKDGSKVWDVKVAKIDAATSRPLADTPPVATFKLNSKAV